MNSAKLLQQYLRGKKAVQVGSVLHFILLRIYEVTTEQSLCEGLHSVLKSHCFKNPVKSIGYNLIIELGLMLQVVNNVRSRSQTVRALLRSMRKDEATT